MSDTPKVVGIDGSKIDEKEHYLFDKVPKDITYGCMLYLHPEDGCLRVAYIGMDMTTAYMNFDLAKLAVMDQATDGEA